MSEFQTPEADTLEQDRDVVAHTEPPPPLAQPGDYPGPIGAQEVNEADHAEQQRSVEFDEDEYR